MVVAELIDETGVVTATELVDQDTAAKQVEWSIPEALQRPR